MNLNEYITNYDVDINDTFLSLYKRLKIINSNGLSVVNLDANHIKMNKEGSFDFEGHYVLTDRGDNSNLIDLTKMFLGSFYNKGTSFKDLSHHSLDRIKDNLDEISSTINDTEYDREYFERVFDGEIIYYQDYLEKKKENKGRAYTKKTNKAYATKAEITLLISVLVLTFLIFLMIIK